jgi:flavodoxin I
MAMQILVAYDSFFGNTEQIAHAIGKELGPGNRVSVLRIGEVKPEHLAGLDLLIVGSPTRAFKATPAITGMLNKIPKNGLMNVRVAAFDTGIPLGDIKAFLLRFLVKLLGYAAKPIAARLRKKGGRLIVPPEGFLVTGTEGPLKAGEVERAAAWARQILDKI